MNGGVLSGQTKRNDGSWNWQDSLDLDTKIGNRNGRFDFDGTNFSKTAQEIRLEGTRLRAELYTDRRGVERDSLDLAGVLEIVDGRFAFNAECVDYLLLYAMCFNSLSTYHSFERQRADRKKLLG